jgi:hypothetical protein
MACYLTHEISYDDYSMLNGSLLGGRIVKHLLDAFPIQNLIKQGYYLSALLSKFALEYASRKVQQN